MGHRSAARNVERLDRAIGVGGDQHRTVDRHAIDDSPVQTFDRSIVQKSHAAP